MNRSTQLARHVCSPASSLPDPEPPRKRLLPVGAAVLEAGMHFFQQMPVSSWVSVLGGSLCQCCSFRLGGGAGVESG